MRRGLLTRRRRDVIASFLLLTLAFRAVIPLGCMPMFGPGYSVQLILCEGYAPLSSSLQSVSGDMAANMAAGLSMDMPMDASGTSGSHFPAHQDHSTCPYGASPIAAVLPVLDVLLPTVQVAAQPQGRSAQISYLKLSPRAQSPRGPPLEA